MRKNWRRTYSHIYEIAKELNHLAHADIIALQEIDWGMPRSNYVHVTQELANELGYGYVYGPEFIEFLDDGILYSKVKNLDEEAFKGLHGNAILAKWPLENVRLIRYAEEFSKDTPSHKEMKHRRCYDWWKEELPKIGPFEKLVYKFGKIVFNEEAIIPSVRLGSRIALVADVLTPAGSVTVASTHLENRGNPKCRRYELEELLNELKDITNQPVVVAGDFNTTNEEARRPYFIHVLYWYIKNQFELSTLIANIGTNVGMFFLDLPFPIPAPIPATVQLINQAREWRNPPGLGSAERKLFRKVIEKFKFEDGTVIDTRGKSPMNPRNSKRILSNSNQATPMGYKPTYCFQRNYKHLFCMKLDWILVKGNLTAAERASKKCKVCPDNTWAPTNPRTLYYSMLAAQASDHAAITTDLIVPD